jgi:Entner-Doudoroff aldolase
MAHLLEKYKVIPVIVLNDEEDAKQKLTLLNEANILVAEITFRTEYALEGIKYATKHFPNFLIGAGTVLNKKQCKQAIDAGCKFIVSPGLSKEIANLCKEKNIPYLPGCVTPTEIIMALDLGINVVKFFPAQAFGGLKTIKSLSSAFKDVKFVPTGGIDNSNLEEYLSQKFILSVGGTWFFKGDAVENLKVTNLILEKIAKAEK